MTALKQAPHVCYHVEFGRSVLKGVRINTGEPPKLGNAGLGSLEMGAGVSDSKMHAPPPHMLPCTTYAFCVKRCCYGYVTVVTVTGPPSHGGVALTDLNFMGSPLEMLRF